MIIWYIKRDSAHAYHKTSSLLKAIEHVGSLHVLYRPTPRITSRLNLVLRIVQWYFGLNRRLRSEQDTIILWLDEFLFNPIDLLLLRVATFGTRSITISGPHVLRQDHAYFVSPKAARTGNRSASTMKQFGVWVLDNICLSLPTVIQTHSQAYSRRLRQQYLARGKPIITCPIGLPSLQETSRPTRQDLSAQGSMVIVFWGIAGPLHGLILLADVAVALKERGIRAHFKCYSPTTDSILELKRAISEKGVEEFFSIKDVHVAQNNFVEVKDAHLAISHLLDPKLSRTAYEVLSNITTNKMMEILALGIPLIVANCSSTLEVVDPQSAFLVPPGSSQAIVDTIEFILRNPSELDGRADSGQRLANAQFSAEQIGHRIRLQLHDLLNPNKSASRV